MGNIVSNAVVPTQLQNPQSAASFSAPQAGVQPVQADPAPSLPSPSTPTTPPMSGTPPTVALISSEPPQNSSQPATITIEGVDAAQPASFNSDPFGPMPTAPEVPEIPTEPDLPSITPEPPPPPAPKPPIEPVVSTEPTTQQSAAELLATMPDVQQMMKDLEKSGCLLPELHIKSIRHIDSSPLAALQPKTLQDQSYFSSPTDEQPMKMLPEVQLASTGAKKRTDPQELPLFVFVAMFSLIQSIQGIAMVAHFVTVKYPEYEQMIVANVLSTSEADAAVVKAIIVGIMAAIGLIFSLLLLIKRSKNRSVEIYIVISIVVINFLVQNILSQNVLASGNPLQLPEIVSEIMAHTKQ